MNKIKSCYQDNREKCLQKMKEWQKDNQGHLRRYREVYNRMNKSKKDRQNKIYYQQNKKYYNDYYSKKYRNEKKFNLTKRMYSIIRFCILRGKAGYQWETYVGYTLEDLIHRLKNALPEGYNWQDYLEGRLELDHIIPISAWNFSEPTDNEFQECWALENLQLLTPKENHLKGSKILSLSL